MKDRYNGSIMILPAGHIVHIDFGFLLGIQPGAFRVRWRACECVRAECALARARAWAV